MTSEEKGTVFVLMPFKKSLESVYRSLIKPAFEGAGFQVLRADDISSQRNILQDIVNSIESADLIVADLTDSNQNVYYELGVAHARGKPAFVMVQNIDDVPFDLRSYRIFQYSMDSDALEDAKARLSNDATRISVGEMRFGNPVSDFGSVELGRQVPQEEVTTTALPHEAQEILKTAVAGDGSIIHLRHFGRPGITVQAGGKSMIPVGADNRTAMAWVAGVEKLVELGCIRDTSGKDEVFEVTHQGYAVVDKLYQGVATQRRVWIEINDGQDVRGSRPMDERAKSIILKHGGERCDTGWRFPDGSILHMMGLSLVASPD